jgi:hypothetical protein
VEILNYAWYDLAGNVGVALIILTYLLLQLEKLTSISLFYSASNTLGAGLVLVSLGFEFNLSAFIVEAFWVLISLVGVARWIQRGHRKRRKPM